MDGNFPLLMAIHFLIGDDGFSSGNTLILLGKRILNGKVNLEGTY